MGGCDLNGNKGQIKDQALAGVNAAMLVNIALGLPLRVLRRNEDPSSSTGSSLIYDGLYNVVSSKAEGGAGDGMRVCTMQSGVCNVVTADTASRCRAGSDTSGSRSPG